MDKNKITTRQLILIITTFGLSTTISRMFSIDLPPANQDTWIVILLSFLYSFIVRIPLIFLINKFPDFTFNKTIEVILGKFLGKLIAILYALYFTAYSVFIVVLQAQLVGSNVLVRTSNWLIIGLLIFIILYIGSKGLVLMCWTSEVVTPLSIFSIILLIILGLKNVDFRILLPVMADSTIMEVNLGALMFSLMPNDIFVLAKCSPYLENKKDITKIYIYASLLFTIISAIAVVVTQGALGIEQARHANYPFMIYTRLINFESAFERIDAIFVITWIASNSVRILFFIYFAYMSYKEVMRLKDAKPMLYFIGALIGIASINIANRGIVSLPPLQVNITQILSAAIFIVLIPLITSIVYFFRRKSLNKKIRIQSQ